MAESLEERRRKNRDRMRAKRASDPGYSSRINKAYRERNPEKSRASDRARSKDPERARYNKEYGSLYRDENRDVLASYFKEYYKVNRDQKIVSICDARRRRRRLDPEKHRIESRNRRLKDPLSIQYADVLANDPCVYCNQDAGTIDHIVPLSRDGSHEFDNLTSACLSCNSQKRNRPLLLFMLATIGHKLGAGRNIQDERQPRSVGQR